MSDINVLSVTQKIIVDPFSSSVAVINAGPMGPAGPVGEVSFTYLNQQLAGKSAGLSGSGSPEGVVTAGVGTEYADVAATNGAVKWIKASGAGNTGWRVMFGDTGVREVQTLLNAGWSRDYYTRLRRVNNECVFNVLFLKYNQATLNNAWVPILTVPVGFRPHASIGEIETIIRTGGGLAPLRIDVNGVISILASAPANSVTVGCVRWPAQTIWPTALPGTAV